ncbi:unnamed protein product [Amoebophrya sp. A25]|nr:unnamed protein product [Amoebophrya sp. A25]|eukprot:GSA25T00019234001.1
MMFTRRLTGRHVIVPSSPDCDSDRHHGENKYASEDSDRKQAVEEGDADGLFLQRLVLVKQKRHDLAAGEYISTFLSVPVLQERWEKYRSLIIAESEKLGTSSSKSAANDKEMHSPKKSKIPG